MVVQNLNFFTLDPQIKILYQNFSCVTFLALLTQTSHKVSLKSNERYLEIFKDWQANRWQGRLLRTLLDKPGTSMPKKGDLGVPW